MFDAIQGSFPPITEDLHPDDYEFFRSLPEAYREFLRAHNGGFVEEFQYTFLTGVPFKTDEVENPSRDDCPVEFFGIPAANRSDSHPEDLLQVLVDHASERFLPRDIIAIARCAQNSLVCISLRPDDRGVIYYWDWYWRYPWCKHFFEQRIDDVTRHYEDPRAILDDTQHPLHTKLQDELNYATLVRLAPSFSEWFAVCEDKRDTSDT